MIKNALLLALVGGMVGCQSMGAICGPLKQHGGAIGKVICYAVPDPEPDALLPPELQAPIPPAFPPGHPGLPPAP